MKYFIISFGLLSSLFLTSCKKYLDINDNPNNATVVDPKLLFSFAATSFINNRAGGDLFIPMALGGQSMSGGGNSTNGVSWGTGSEDSYVFSPFSVGNIWTQYYTSVGLNLKKAIEFAEASGNNNGAAQSKVILAQLFYELTTIYGDVPFTEALDDNIKYPKFDAQKDIIEGSIALIDEALAQFNETSVLKFTGSYALFYGGTIASWKKAAKSLKLRMLMTLVDKDPTKASAIGTLLTSGGFISAPSENMRVAFESTAGKRNPKYAIGLQYNGGLDFFYASPYVVDFMNSINDPRLPRYFDKPATSPTYVGVQGGADANDAVVAKIASTVHTAAQPEFLFTYQEQLFYEAEIYLRGLGVTANVALANTQYKKAIEQSAIFWGVAPATATAFATGLPSLATLSAADALKAVHYHHWVDKFDRGIDAFTQWRRSGAEGNETPALTLPVGAPAGGLFRRFTYPITPELSANPNAPELIEFNVKMWFDL